MALRFFLANSITSAASSIARVKSYTAAFMPSARIAAMAAATAGFFPNLNAATREKLSLSRPFLLLHATPSHWQYAAHTSLFPGQIFFLVVHSLCSTELFRRRIQLQPPFCQPGIGFDAE